MPVVLVARACEPPTEAALTNEHRLWQAQALDDDESFLLPNPLGPSREAPVATPQHKQEIVSSLYRSRGSVMATGARTRIDDGISEGLRFSRPPLAPAVPLLRGHRDRMIPRGGDSCPCVSRRYG